MDKTSRDDAGTMKGREGIFRLLKETFLRKDKKTLYENFFSMSMLQGANYILPLITIPYLVRVLEPEKFGLMAFAQGFIDYFIVLVNFGFNLSATRDIAADRHDTRRVAEIFYGVTVIKAALSLVGIIILGLLVFSIPKFRPDWPLYFITYGAVVGNLLFPLWYFQGMEKMKLLSTLQIMARVASAVLIFVFIRKPGDYIYVPLLTTICFSLAGFLAFSVAARQLNYPFFKAVLLGRAALLRRFKDGSKLFFVQFFSQIYTASGVFVSGLFFGNAVAGYYSVVEKLILALKAVLNPLSQALYPYFAAGRDPSQMLKRYLKLVPLAAAPFFFTALGVFFWADGLIGLCFGGKYTPSISILRFLSPVFFIAPVYNLLSYQVFLPLKRDREFILTVVVPAVTFLILTPLLLTVKRELSLFLGVILLAETMVLAMRIFYLARSHDVRAEKDIGSLEPAGLERG